MKGKDYKACLLLGGNMNDVKAMFKRVLTDISVFAQVIKTSQLYKTKAWGMEEGTPDFINQAVIIQAKFEPFELLKQMQRIESKFGRVRKEEVGYASRTIDIDIIFFGDITIRSETLTVPHPRMHERNFVLVPLAEIAGAWVHPVFHKSVAQILSESIDTLEVIKVPRL